MWCIKKITFKSFEKETMTSNNKHFASLIYVDGKLINVQPRVTPITIESIGFTWWELFKRVFTFKRLVVSFSTNATSFAEGRMKGVLGSIQLVPVRVQSDVQSKKTRPNHTNQE